MSEFNKWVRDNFYSPYDVPTPEQAFEAGQQSKQAEVDHLQEKIDEAIYDLQHIESAMWEEQVEHVLRILKGNTNDH